jgi:hypothetical protein
VTCGKRTYTTRDEADEGVAIFTKKRGKPHRAYKCPACHFFHLSSKITDAQRRTPEARRRKNAKKNRKRNWTRRRALNFFRTGLATWEDDGGAVRQSREIQYDGGISTRAES